MGRTGRRLRGSTRSATTPIAMMIASSTATQTLARPQAAMRVIYHPFVRARLARPPFGGAFQQSCDAPYSGGVREEGCPCLGWHVFSDGWSDRWEVGKLHPAFMQQTGPLE